MNIRVPALYLNFNQSTEEKPRSSGACIKVGWSPNIRCTQEIGNFSLRWFSVTVFDRRIILSRTVEFQYFIVNLLTVESRDELVTGKLTSLYIDVRIILEDLRIRNYRSITLELTLCGQRELWYLLLSIPSLLETVDLTLRMCCHVFINLCLIYFLSFWNICDVTSAVFYVLYDYWKLNSRQSEICVNNFAMEGLNWANALFIWVWIPIYMRLYMVSFRKCWYTKDWLSVDFAVQVLWTMMCNET